MSQVEIAKRTMIVVLIAGAAATLLMPRNAPSGSLHTDPTRPPIDHGVVLTQADKPAAPRHKSSLRVLPAETPATTIALVGLRAKA